MRTWLVLLSLPCALAAQATSGPAAGAEVAPIRAYAATGPYRGREFDVAAELGARPAAVLFVQTVNRETAQPIRMLDDLAAEYRVLGFRSFTVRLNADRTAGEEEIARISNAMNLRNPIVLSLDGAEGPGDFALNRRCTLTLVTTKDGGVVRSLAFTDTGAKDRDRIVAAIEEVAGALPPSPEERVALLPDDPARLKAELVASWRELDRLRQQLEQQRSRGRMQRQERARRPGAEASRRQLPGAVPDDPELVGLMRRFNRAKTEADVDALFAAVDAAVGDDPARRAAMTQGFVRLLATTYGTDYAREKARTYVGRSERKPARAGGGGR